MAVGKLVTVWAAMLVLLGLSIGATLLPIGFWRQAISLGIAAIKAALILWVFMNLRRADGLTRLAAVAAAVFLAILFTLLIADEMTRGWLGS